MDGQKGSCSSGERGVEENHSRENGWMGRSYFGQIGQSEGIWDIPEGVE